MSDNHGGSIELDENSAAHINQQVFYPQDKHKQPQKEHQTEQEEDI